MENKNKKETAVKMTSTPQKNYSNKEYYSLKEQDWKREASLERQINLYQFLKK